MLTVTEFKRLRLDAGYLLGTSDPQAFGETGELADDGVHLALVLEEWDEASQVAESIGCYVDLGAVAQDRKLEVFEDMLELNLTIGRRSDGMFGFDRESGHALVSTRLDPDSFSQATEIAEYIHEFRQFTRQIHDRWVGAGWTPGTDALVMVNLA